MSRPRKYIEGPVARDPMVIFYAIMRGDWVFMHGRPKHPSFVSSMQINAVAGMARAGRFAIAIPNPAHPENQKEA